MPPDQLDATGRWASDPLETTGQWAPAPVLPPHLAAEPGGGASGVTAVFGHVAGAGEAPARAVPGDPFQTGGHLPPEPTRPAAAWAEEEPVVETGFLAADWSSIEEPDHPDDPGPRRRRGRRRPPPRDREWPDEPTSTKGRTRLALLAVAAVAVVLGGTVVGVRLVSAQDTPKDCTDGTCAVMPTAQPAPTLTDEALADPLDSEDPEVELADPTPTATASAPVPRRTTTPRPTPKPTKKAPVDDSDFPDPTSEPEPSPEASQPTALNDPILPTDEPSTVATTTPPVTPPTTETGQSGGATVKVGFTMSTDSRARSSGYTARLLVANDSTEPLPGWTLSLAVGGEVADVVGADWYQDGETLVIESVEDLPAGAQVEIVFRAYGEATAPETCELNGGDCAITA